MNHFSSLRDKSSVYVDVKTKGPVFFKSGYPVGVFFKGCEIFSEKFKGSEKRTAPKVCRSCILCK